MRTEVPMAHHPTDRVGAVCFDAMFTILEPVLSRAELEAKIFSDVAGIVVNPEELMLRIRDLKQQHPRSGKDMDRYWPPLNRMLLEHYGVTGDLDAKAHVIHARHYADATLYAVRDDMRALLEWVVAERVAVIAIASNQEQKRLIELLRHHDALKYFENGGRGTTRVFTSERLGAAKPSRRFLRRLALKMGLSSVREIVLVGNSLENDAQAAQLGVRTAILDRSGKFGEMQITLPGVTPVDGPAAIRTWIEQMCGTASAFGPGNGGLGSVPAGHRSAGKGPADARGERKAANGAPARP